MRSNWMMALCMSLTTASITDVAHASPIAEIICAPTAEMLHRLETQFRAERSAVGMRSPEQMMELWTEVETGDWQLVVSNANGSSCIVAMGEHWQDMSPAAPNKS